MPLSRADVALSTMSATAGIDPAALATPSAAETPRTYWLLLFSVTLNHGLSDVFSAAGSLA